MIFGKDSCRSMGRPALARGGDRSRLLRPLPDAFVNGRAALLAFASASALLALVLLSLQ